MNLLRLTLHLLMSALAFCYPTTLKKKCIHHMVERKSVDLLGTQMRMGSVHYLELKQGIKTLEECVDLCCSNALCDVALYNNDNRGNGLIGSCSLIRCQPLKDCAWRETVTVTGAMIFRGNKLPPWPRSRHVVRPDVQKIAQRLKRDSGPDKVTRLGVLGDTDTKQGGQQKSPDQTKANVTNATPGKQPAENVKKVTPVQQQSQPVQEQKQPEPSLQPATNPKPVPTSPKPSNASANLGAPKAESSGPTLPKDAQTNQPVVTPDHENPVPNVHTPGNDAPTAPNKENMTAQEVKEGEKANLTAVGQIYSVVDKLKNAQTKTAALPGEATEASPTEKQNEAPKANGSSKPNGTAQASGQDSAKASTSPPPPPPTSDITTVAPSHQETPPPPKDVNDTKTEPSPDGDEPLVVNPVYDSTNPETVSVSPKLTSPSGGDSASTTLLKRTTRALTTEEGEVSNVTAPAGSIEKQTTVPADASEIQNILGQLDHEDKKASSTLPPSKDLSDHGASTNAYIVNLTTGETVSTSEQPQNTTNSNTTTPQPDASSSVAPETTLQNTTTQPVTTMISSELSSLLDKLLGTSSPPVETKTTKTQVMVTTGSEKTTISITNQNTTPVETPKPGNASEVQADTNHSGVTANGSLVAALSFGCIFFFGVVLLIGKRCYDGYQRRHYSKVDYLVNGMYN